jgi:group I intron endonuclease
MNSEAQLCTIIKNSIIPYGYVYILVNKINQKKYIGQTTRPYFKRMREHLSCSSSLLLQRAIKKYGKENFIFCTLYIAYTKKDLDALEIEAIKKFSSQIPAGYNIAPGGLGHLGNKSWLGRCHSKETKIKIGNSLKGKARSLESRKKQSASVTGKNNPNFGQGEKIAGKLSVFAKKVICIETGRVFDTLTEASNYLGITPGTLCGHLKGCQKTCKKTHWKYYEK